MKKYILSLSLLAFFTAGCATSQKNDSPGAPALEIEEEFPPLKKGEIAYLSESAPVVTRYKETGGQLVSEKCDKCEALNLAKEMHLMSPNYIERLSFCRSNQGVVRAAKVHGVTDNIEICVLENGEFYRIN